MNNRSLALTVTGVMLALAMPAYAGPKKVCNLLQDVPGDATQYYVNLPSQLSTPNTPTMDILSADVSSNAKTLTTAVRVAALKEKDDASPFGMIWRVTFKLEGQLLYTKAFSDKTFEIGFFDSATGADTKLATATGVLDTTTNEVRVSAPVLSFLSGVIKIAPNSGKKATDIRAETLRNVPSPLVASPVDTGSSTKTYTFGSPSCVTPGK